jgi:hypothetical protein
MSVVLQTEEFAYMLAVVEAEAVVGVDDPNLFPDPVSGEAIYKKGLEQLVVDGYAQPTGKPEEYAFDDTLSLMVADVGHPDFVVFTIRNTDEGRRVVLHYLAGPDIVELAAEPDDTYILGAVADRKAMVARIQDVLALPATNAKNAAFTIEAPTFETIQDLAEAGDHEQATNMLHELGLNNGRAESLVTALGEPDASGLVAVVRPNQGQVTAGRKASLYRGGEVVWLAKRMDATSSLLGVETVQADTLPNVLESYLEFLAK